MPDAEAVPVGDLLNRLGVVFYPVEGDSVEGALVIMKVVEEDGTEKISMQHAGLGWLERLGMLRQIELLESNPNGFSGDDDD